MLHYLITALIAKVAMARYLLHIKLYWWNEFICTSTLQIYYNRTMTDLLLIANPWNLHTITKALVVLLMHVQMEVTFQFSELSWVNSYVINDFIVLS
jgi:hypothetical protein